MKALTIDHFGSDADLHLTDFQIPRPKQGEILIRVKSAGVGIWDEMYIQGELPIGKPKFPLIPGWEGAGVITALGPGVRKFKVGDEVFYFDYGKGAWAESVAVPARSVAKKPKHLGWEQAGGLPIISLTAWQALREGLRIKRGQTLLITNGAGGVGTCAIQFANLMGVKTIALASKRNHAFIKGLGADWAFDYHEEFTSDLREIFSDGVDCVLDNIGNKETVSKAIPCLRRGGTFLTIVDRFEDIERKDVKNKSFEVKPSGEQLTEIARLVDKGKFRSVVDRAYPLEKVRDALKKVEGGHVHGKVVLKVA